MEETRVLFPGYSIEVLSSSNLSLGHAVKSWRQANCMPIRFPGFNLHRAWSGKSCEEAFYRLFTQYKAKLSSESNFRVHIIMSSQSRPHSSIQVFYISEVSSSSASFIFFFWVWSWHLPKDYFIKHSASHSAEKASSSRDASQALSEVAKADFSSVIFESLVRQLLWGSLILLQTHHLVQS